MKEVQVLEKIDEILFKDECCAECKLNEIIHVISVYINARATRIHRRKK